MHNFTPDVIIRDLPHHIPAADCPRHPIPPRTRDPLRHPSLPLYRRILTHLSVFLSAAAGRLSRRT